MTSEHAAGEAVDRRICGRCRQEFAGDPDLYFQSDWALCPACTAVLMPGPDTASGGPAA